MIARLKTAAAALALCLAAAHASGPTTDVGALVAGEHTPILYSAAEVVKGAAHPCTTAWKLVGMTPYASPADNREIGRFNPERFSLALKLACWGAGDSAKLSQARFELAADTTVQAIWNADSSNIFAAATNFTHPLYGLWTFLPPPDTARAWVYPLRLWQGGWVRFIFTGGVADTVAVNWSLTCEH